MVDDGLPTDDIPVCQQVRETETWMPLKAAVTHQQDSQESSGDFGFTDNEDNEEEEEEDYYYDDWENEDEDDEDEDYEDEVSGSGDNGAGLSQVFMPKVKNLKHNFNFVFVHRERALISQT